MPVASPMKRGQKWATIREYFFGRRGVERRPRQALHLGPENALAAHRLLGSGALMPVHWGTFDLALHAWDEPAETLVTRGIPMGVHLVTPRLGRPVEPAHVESVDAWWRGLGRSHEQALHVASPVT